MNLREFEIKLFGMVPERHLTMYNLKELIEIHMRKSRGMEFSLKNGLRFLEKECSLLYGYTGEFIGTDSKITKGILSLFESALVYTLLLNSGINTNILTSLESLFRSQQNGSGLWNFFLRDDSRPFQTIDDDIDDSSLAAMSLYLGKQITREDCIQICEKMMENFVFDKNGLLGTFMKQPTDDKDQAPHILVTRFTKRPPIDIGSCANCFWLFGSLGLDNILESKFQPTLELIGEGLEQIGKDETNITHAWYYTNPNIISFFISRFIMASKLAENLYKEKMINLILKKIKSNNSAEKNEPIHENVIDIACQIIAAINMNLHIESNEKENVKVYLVEKLEKMLSLQLPDGSFPRAAFYKWAPLEIFAVSKAVSTAFAVCAIKLALDSDINNTKPTK